jgi:hypothetical protein
MSREADVHDQARDRIDAGLPKSLAERDPVLPVERDS